MFGCQKWTYVKFAKRGKKGYQKRTNTDRRKKKKKLQSGMEMQRCLLVAASMQIRDTHDLTVVCASAFVFATASGAVTLPKKNLSPVVSIAFDTAR